MENNIYSIIEGILFTMGEPVEIDKIAFAIDKDIKSTKLIMDEVISEYDVQNRGMRIIEVDGSYQMVSNPSIFSYLIKVAKQPPKIQLTSALLETLSIIAYKQPTTKAEVEKIRGVNSDYAVNKLIEYEVVEEVGRSDTIGRPILFGTSKQFLRMFGIKSIQELKELVEIDKGN